MAAGPFYCARNVRSVFTGFGEQCIARDTTSCLPRDQDDLVIMSIAAHPTKRVSSTPTSAELTTRDRHARLREVVAQVRRDGTVTTRSGKRVSISPTGLDERSAAALRQLVLESHAVRTIETGLALGLSSLAILDASFDNAGSHVPSHTAIDPFQQSGWGNAGLVTLARAGVSDLVRFLEADSTLELPRLCSAGEVFDAAFVDGGHLFEHVFIDTHFLLRMVRPGGIVVIDDWWMPAVRMGVDYFEKNLGITREICSDISGAERFAVLRVPERRVERPWDHFVPFTVASR